MGGNTDNNRGVLHDEMAEWLGRWTANPMCSARVGSNPILVAASYFSLLARDSMMLDETRTITKECYKTRWPSGQGVGLLIRCALHA